MRGSRLCATRRGSPVHHERAGHAQLLDERADDVARLLASSAGLGSEAKTTVVARSEALGNVPHAATLSSAPALRALGCARSRRRASCCAAMRAPIALSKTKLLSLAQCRRKLWLETYSPELVDEPSAEKIALLATGNTSASSRGSSTATAAATS